MDMFKDEVKEPGTLKPAYNPRRWRHHRTEHGPNGNRPVPPGPTMLYRGPTTEGCVVANTEEEYNDYLNRGYKDTPDPKAWEQKA